MLALGVVSVLLSLLVLATVFVALACLYSCIESWGDNWLFTGVLALGVLICGTIGFFDLRRSVRK